MADSDDREARWPEGDESESGPIWTEEDGLDFLWERDEPEPEREPFLARLREELERLLSAVPGTRQYWSRLQESVDERVGLRLEAFQGMTSLSASQKQALLLPVHAMEEIFCPPKLHEKEMTDRVMPSLAVLIVAVMGLLAPLAANARWVGGEYPFLIWVLLCCATLIAGSVLGLGALVLAIGVLSVAPRRIRKTLRDSTAMLIVPLFSLPGLAILGFWLARAVAALGVRQPDAWGLLSVTVPLAGLGAALVFVGVIVIMTMAHFVHASRMARRHTEYLIPYAFLNILQEVEAWRGSWGSASLRRDLVSGLEGVVDLILRRLPRHLGCGDPITDTWTRTMTAEMANQLRWLKTGLLLPEPGGWERFIDEVVEALIHSADGRWGSLRRRPLDRPLWRQAVCQATGRFAVYLQGAAWALAPALALWAVQRTSYALSGWAADLVTAGVLLWAAILLLAILDRSVAFGTPELLGLETPSWWRADRQQDAGWGIREMDVDAEGTVFVTVVGNAEQRDKAELLIDSLRTFGGAMRECPVWLFEADSEGTPCGDLVGGGVEVYPLILPERVRGSRFAGKVFACARAEEMAGPDVRSLVWVAPDCLIIQPPVLLALGPNLEAAVRPVHHKNVGLRVDEPLDTFWRGVYQAVGVADIPVTVDSFVDRQLLRAYYNSHILAVKPARGIFREWSQVFEALVGDRVFQEAACQDELHQVFLHQAVLSALLAGRLQEECIRTLSSDYCYPYNLHRQVPAGWGEYALNSLVCVAYEDRPLHPDQVDDIEIYEPLRSWLAARVEPLEVDS